MPRKKTHIDEMTALFKSSGLRRLDDGKFNLDFKDLMKFRIEKILMVCSLYDYYTIIEDGHLQELIFNEYIDLNLHHAPKIKRTFSSSKAMELLSEGEFDLIIITLRPGNMEFYEFSKKVKKKYSDIPLVLLSSQSRELQFLIDKGDMSYVDKLFIWSGDRKVFLAMIKLFEDMKNAPEDCKQYGITAIVLIEDSPSFYSSYLPLIYAEVMAQTQKLILDGKNSAQKLLRQRARPKILHAETFEEAMAYVNDYKESLLGIITDLEFEYKGNMDPNAGIKFIKKIKRKLPGVPILLQTSQTEKKGLAEENQVAFLDKNSRTLLKGLRKFMKENFGFGDFVFRMPDGNVVDSAKNLNEFRHRMMEIPEESLIYHSNNNHFSYWLKARTEFEMANKFIPVHLDQFNNPLELKNKLVSIITNQLREDSRGTVTVFDGDNYDEDSRFQIIGEGSLGGKARGLAFLDQVMKSYLPSNYFEGVEISIPKSIILGTDVFTEFIEENNLFPAAIENVSNEKIQQLFMEANFNGYIINDLSNLLDRVHCPLAVRSSSLLEDAIYQPFAGIYSTVMIPNSSPDKAMRLQNLIQVIKFVYASTFTRRAKNYLEATGNRLEEEQMAIILQELVGRKYGDYFYPHFSGVARSYNFYPFGNARPEDGIVSLALGLGKTIVDGSKSLQYSPKYPDVYPQFSTTKDYFSKSQLGFWALHTRPGWFRKNPSEEFFMKELTLQNAESDGTIRYLASTYSPENDLLYEGISRDGARILNFAPILKSEVIPLNEILKVVLRISEVAMNSPVEIEFAVSLGEDGPKPAMFSILQVRPMVKNEGSLRVNLENIASDKILLQTNMALGNGAYQPDTIIYIKPDSFEASATAKIAGQINEMNQKLVGEGKQYLLFGPGRWGSSDPWLGIPVDFSDITGARVIIETQLPNMIVEPSQGSHFFQNLTSFKIAYLTIKEYSSDNSVNWDWFNRAEAAEETEYLKLIRLKKPIEVLIDGQTGKGLILEK